MPGGTKLGDKVARSGMKTTLLGLVVAALLALDASAAVYGKYRGKYTEHGGFLERGDGSVTVARSDKIKVVQFTSFGRIDTEFRLLPRGKITTSQKINGSPYWVGRGTWRTTRSKVLFSMTLSTVDGRANLRGQASFLRRKMYLVWRMPLSKFAFAGSK